ncbi:MAG: energy transducer TonB [Nevskiaceae bacterium]
MTFRLRHLVAALALHAVLLVLLAGGVQCSAKTVQPPVITGVLLDPSRQDAAQRKREEQRKAEQARLQREAEARKKAQAEAKKKQEAEAKKKQADEALRLKQAAEKKAAEKKKADEAARREAELAAQARAEGERLEKIGEWAAALIRHVQGNYRKPPGAPDDFACQVRMQLLPDGTVTNAKILKSCGSVLLDRAVEEAVLRSSPMPRPADPSVFDRDLTINFTP